VKIAVTGGMGFCGRAVTAEARRRGHDVITLGRSPGNDRHWNAERPDLPDLTGADAVIHLAAAVGDPGPGPAAAARYRLINVDGTARLAAAADGRPIVHASSASVYRPGPYTGPLAEDHPTDRQRNAYGRTKAQAEDRAGKAVILRPRAVYGPGDPHLLPRLRRIIRGGRAWLPGPDVPLSLTAAGNLAAACLDALEKGWPAGAYNIADAETYRRDAAVETVLRKPVAHLPIAAAKVLTWTPALSVYALDQLTDGMVLDIGKARAAGWEPQSGLLGVDDA
jgi:nucleoside-diphosphate-sugar epimerase